MATAKLLNVAGSIGGVAKSVSDLNELINGNFFDNLKPAMYGDVPFAVESNRLVTGRKTVVHDYPYRDEVWVEDLGQRSRQFEIVGYLIENDPKTGGGSVISQRDNLLEVCEMEGGWTLIHPTLGRVRNVCCLSCEVVERRDLGTVFEIRLTLIRSGLQLFPKTTTSTASASATAAHKTGLAALADFAKGVASTLAAGAAIVQQAVSTAVGWYQIGVAAVNDVKRFMSAVSTLAGNFGSLFGSGNSGVSGSNTQAPQSTTVSDLLAASAAARASVFSAGTTLQSAASNPSDSTTLGNSAQAYVAAVAASASGPADAVRLVSSMAQYTPSAATPPGPIGSSMSTMQTALGALLRRCALAQLATSLTSYQPSSQEDADATMAAAVSLIDDEIDIAGDSGDDASFQALRELRQAVVADLQSRGANLAAVSTFQFNAPLPALVLANRIYRDSTRADQLVTQVKPIHPAFCPTKFKALSN